jgi:thermostable 8-oxoguanine DNA glycosylase
MGLKRLKYSSLGDLLDHEHITSEDPGTADIIRRLRGVKINKRLSRGEFLDICYWKSPRSIRLCKRNSAKKVETVSRAIFSTRSERKRLELLTSLHGVSVPTASAILALIDPKNYGVIDIRAWQLLYRLNSVEQKPRGQNFRYEHWYHYLRILRHHAKRLGIHVRLVELSLFKYHQNHQRGSLYENKTQGRNQA